MIPAGAVAPWLIVGLGNPGEQYARTRHNVGAMVIDELLARGSERLSGNGRLRADVCQTRIGGEAAVLAVPRSFMNESGGPVKALCQYYGVEPERLLVVHDELDIDFASLRVKRGGGDGGHNGLRSIRSALGTGEYVRLRVGIGRPPGRQDPAGFVLRPFSSVERDELAHVLDAAADAVESVLVRGVETTQNDIHTRGS